MGMSFLGGMFVLTCACNVAVLFANQIINLSRIKHQFQLLYIISADMHVGP